MMRFIKFKVLFKQLPEVSSREKMSILIPKLQSEKEKISIMVPKLQSEKEKISIMVPNCSQKRKKYL